jgi:two-component system NtrC family sensor kinase
MLGPDGRQAASRRVLPAFFDSWLESLPLPARFREAIPNIEIAPQASSDQEQIGRLIIFDDVTDRAELEQRLLQPDLMSSIGLAAGIAH